MRLVIKRSGGYAGGGEVPVATIDTARLEPSRAQVIENCIDQLARLEEQFGTDMVRYVIQVQDDRGTRELVVLDEANPDSALHRLLGAVGASH